MRRRIALLSLFAAGLAAVLAPAAAVAQNPVAEDLKQDTADGVQLNCKFYKSPASKNGSVVVLMHNYLQDPNKGGWDDLAKRLAKEGYHVLRPDFRGHGNSKDVNPKQFFDPNTQPFNRAGITGGTKNPPLKSIDAKSFKSNYFPALVNDLAAVRTLIDTQNDAGAVNAGSIYLIGAQEMAALGMLFLASEWHREAEVPQGVGLNNVVPNFVAAGRPRFPNSKPAGKDYAGCVWLSASRPNTITSSAIKGFAAVYGKDVVGNTGDLRTSNHMLFLHGEKDEKGKKDAAFYYDEVLVAKGNPRLNVDKLEFTYEKSVPGTTAAGVALLGKNDTLKTENTIVEYLAAMEKERGKKPVVQRKYTRPLIVQFQSFGVSP